MTPEAAVQAVHDWNPDLEALAADPAAAAACKRVALLLTGGGAG